MIKTLSLLKRKEGLARAAFRAHYEEKHAPLARPLLTGLRRYVRYHVAEEVHGRCDFDVLTYFRYADKAATDQVFETLSGPKGEAVRADEDVFMDKPANRFFAVSERVLQGQPSDETSTSTFVCVARSAEQTRFDASARFVREHWPKLQSLCGVADFVLLRDAFGMAGDAGGGPAPFDQIVQVSGDAPLASDPRLVDWAAALEGAGSRVVIVATERVES